MKFLVINAEKLCPICEGFIGEHFHCPACLGTHCELVPLEEALHALQEAERERKEELNRKYGLPPGSELC